MLMDFWSQEIRLVISRSNVSLPPKHHGSKVEDSGCIVGQKNESRELQISVASAQILDFAQTLNEIEEEEAAEVVI